MLASLSACAEGATASPVFQRALAPLDTRWMCAAETGGAQRADWAKALPIPSFVELPSAWSFPAGETPHALPFSPGPASAVWYAHDVALPAKTDKLDYVDAEIVIENPIGNLEVYSDGRLLATLLGNGLTRRVLLPALPGSKHRLAIRIDRDGLPAVLRRLDCGLGPVSVELLPLVRLEALLPAPSPEKQTLTVRYRIYAAAAARAQLRVEIIPPKTFSGHATHTQPLDLLAGTVDGEVTLPLKHFAYWSPEQTTMYKLRVTVNGPGRTGDTAEMYCGMMRLSEHAGMLQLDGKPLFLKGLRLPGGIPHLVDTGLPQALATELAVARQAGFTAVMADGAALPEELLTLADRLGLLVILEIPPAPGKDSTSLEIPATVWSLASHPSLLAWSVPAGETQHALATVRTLDRRHPVLVRDGVHSQLFFPLATDGSAYADIDATHDDWETTLSQAMRDALPILASGLNADYIETLPGEESYTKLRKNIEQLRRSDHTLGYFVRPAPGASFTGLLTLDGEPAQTFVATQAFNQPCLLTLQSPSSMWVGDTLQPETGIVNDERLKGQFQVYRYLATPDGQNTIERRTDFTLTGERIQDISQMFPGIPLKHAGRYRVYLVLADANGDTVLATDRLNILARQHPLPTGEGAAGSGE